MTMAWKMCHKMFVTRPAARDRRLSIARTSPRRVVPFALDHGVEEAGLTARPNKDTGLILKKKGRGKTQSGGEPFCTTSTHATSAGLTHEKSVGCALGGKVTPIKKREPVLIVG